MLHIHAQLKSTYVLSPSWSHCFARVLLRTAIVLRHLAALLAMPAFASSSARSSLIIEHSLSCFAMLSRMSRCGHECCFISIFDHCVNTLVLATRAKSLSKMLHILENERFSVEIDSENAILNEVFTL